VHQRILERAHVPGVTGSTDLGDGLPTLVLDLLSLTGSLGESRPS